MSDFMIYTRGTKEDYDRYAKISGDPGWGWDKLQRYFREVSAHCSVLMGMCIYYSPIILQNEDFVAPADHHSISGQFNPSVHSNKGINSVSLFGFAQPIDSRVIQTTQQLAEFPYRLDYNSGEHIGIGMFSFSCHNFR